MKKTGKVEKNWIGSYRQGRPGLAGPGPGRAGPGAKTRSAAQTAKSEKTGKVKKNWIGSYRHKVGPGWGRPGWPGQAAGVRQGRAGPGQARPLGCCPGGWKVKKLEK